MTIFLEIPFVGLAQTKLKQLVISGATIIEATQDLITFIKRGHRGTIDKWGKVLWEDDLLVDNLRKRAIITHD